MIQTRAILLFVIFGLIQSRFIPSMFQKSELRLDGMTTHRFSQLLDHYDYLVETNWSQRYHVYNDYYKPSGPVYLYLCGQWVCDGATAGALELAKQTNGLVIALQHRFYGQSMPFGDGSLQIDKLKYLSTEQALKDTAYFITSLKSQKLHNITNNPWIVIGGSYPGAMVAWFRYKYPHLTVGSISSSGVINAIEDFKSFDQNIYLASVRSDPQCPQSIRKSFDYVQALLASGQAQNVKASFGADKLSNVEFLWYWADVLVFEIQYGSRSSLCNILFGKTAEQQFNQISKLAKGVNPRQYSTYWNTNPAYYNSGGQVLRAWNYQVCTQFGWLQTYSGVHPQRSKLLDLAFYRDYCNKTYGVIPSIQRSNTEFGGLDINVSNLFMVNAYEDPWRWASLQKSSNQVISILLNCTNCAHCVDLHGSSAQDDPQLTQVRAYRLKEVNRWISQYWNSVGQSFKTKPKKAFKLFDF